MDTDAHGCGPGVLYGVDLEFTRRDLAAAIVTSSENLLPAAIAATLRRPMLDPIERFAFLVPEPDSELDRLYARHVFEEVVLWLQEGRGEAIETPVTLAVNSPLPTLQRASRGASGGAFLYAAVDFADGQLALVADEHVELLGEPRPTLLAKALRALVSPRRILSVAFEPDTLSERRALSVEIERLKGALR